MVDTANYTITHKCGHTEAVNLIGKGDGRRKKLEWMASQDCLNCQAKAAAEDSKNAGLSALKGSKKQVRWAEQIRAEKVAEVNSNADRFKQGFNFRETDLKERALKVVDNIRDRFAEQTSASWWIEHKDYDVDFNYEMTEAEKIELRNIIKELKSRRELD